MAPTLESSMGVDYIPLLTALQLEEFDVADQVRNRTRDRMRERDWDIDRERSERDRERKRRAIVRQRETRTEVDYIPLLADLQPGGGSKSICAPTRFIPRVGE